MSDSINLLKNVGTLDISPINNGYTKVIINVGTDNDGNVIYHEAGVDGGAVLTVNNPWGTQEMAENILAKISGWQYQPYSASGALLDPSAELGDGVNIDGTYGGIFNRSTKFTSLMKSEISAPANDEIEHEYTSAVESASDRAYSRLVKSVNSRISQTASQIALEVQARTAADDAINSQLQIQAGQISAKVSKQGGSASSFGWTLDDSSWTLQSNGRTVLKADSSGLHIEGEITAKSGSIGGFTIDDTYINYGGLTWEGSASNGIYIGTSGIKLGNGFKVDTGGNLTANNLNANNAVLTGNLKVGDYYIQANDLRDGAVGGNDWSSDSGGGVTRGYASAWNDACTSGLSANKYPSFFRSYQIYASDIRANGALLVNDGSTSSFAYWRTIYIDGVGYTVLSNRR